jgi:(E)-4-hydroxy-3-methyl-but-2-enyl pyrophosphate reductase
LEIVIAKTAGFCFGVNKAVQLVNELIERNVKNIYTLGPVIHNEQVVDRLKANGVKVIEDISEIEEGEQSLSHLVIRAHGVTPGIYDEISAKGLDVIDATCPYVKKIHNLVRDKYEQGFRIIIIGDRSHPEVKGINGWCGNSATMVESEEDARKLPQSDEPCCVVAQTTLSKGKWELIIDILEKKFKNLIKFDTICYATSSRQAEAKEIAETVDVMIVVGSRSSSNTQKLYDLCRKICPDTYKIETFGDLPPLNIEKVKRIGITAGASTPDWIIKEVIEKMEELNKQDSEMSFKEAFEQSLVTLKTGEIVKGRIIGFSNTEVYVDLGFKSDGVITKEEFSDDPDFEPEENLKIGDEIEAFVVRVNDGEGNVVLSKKKVDAMKGWAMLEEAFENKTPVKAKVIEETNGGLIASAQGIRIFIPASQVGERYVKDLKEFLKQTINIRIIEFNKHKKKLVGSQRILFTEERARREEELWSGIEVGRKYAGTVDLHFHSFPQSAPQHPASHPSRQSQ